MQATGRFARRNGIARKRPMIIQIQRQQIQRQQTQRHRQLAHTAAGEGLSPVVVLLMPTFAILLFVIFVLLR